MVAPLELSKLLLCTILLVGGFPRPSESKELDQSLAEREVAQGKAAQAAMPGPRQKAKPTFVIHGYEGTSEAARVRTAESRVREARLCVQDYPLTENQDENTASGPGEGFD